MNPKKYKITINATGISLEELPSVLKQIEKHTSQGYVEGSVYNNMKNYNFKALEI